MRESGYYWVILKDPFKLGTDSEDEIIFNDPATVDGWEVAFFEKGEGWCSMWEGGYYPEEIIYKVNENKLMP